MGLFTGFNEAVIGGGGIYFQDGVYVVEVLKCFVLKTRQKEDMFIVECMILVSDNDKRPRGQKSSCCINLKHDAAYGNIKAFLAAANQIEPDDDERVNAEITEEIVEFAVSDDNPLAGVQVGLKCTTIQTKAKTDFTKHDWSVVPQPA